MTDEAISLEDMSKEEMATLTERVVLALCEVQDSISELFHSSRALLDHEGPADKGALQVAIVGHVQTCSAVFQKLEQQRQLLVSRPTTAAN